MVSWSCRGTSTTHEGASFLTLLNSIASLTPRARLKLARLVVEVLCNAIAWFAARGVTVERVLTDNGGCYRLHPWRETCTKLGITHKRTRPYRPQTNGKIKRFYRTLAEGWAFKKLYPSKADRLAAQPGSIHFYNHHRPHSAIGKQPPITRLNNLTGHHN